MLLSQSYYDILEIDQHATIADIKKSFRLLALKHHPDKNKSSESHQKFLQIVEAYEVLSDENSRRKYDLVNTSPNQSFNFTPSWTPSADLSKFYSYDVIKNWYVPNKSTGGMWDIGEKENLGMWKTTLALFGSLACVAVFIIILSN
ncbi:MAG TPA: J domain-containing protein [Candidatus Nitrosocosmicus sp.]|jgi:DnaJ-class molecular chaperone|nr:J domain-containing protein [Candidatus Nitrosocosmicus sp.]